MFSKYFKKKQQLVIKLIKLKNIQLEQIPEEVSKWTKNEFLHWYFLLEGLATVFQHFQ